MEQAAAFVETTGRSLAQYRESVHRLVQAVARDQTPPAQREAWRRTAAALVGTAVPYDTALRSTWSICRLLLPHAALVADPRGHHLWCLASALGYSGDYATARTWFQTIMRAHEDALGPEHRDTLDARHNLAYWTGMAGDAAAARDMMEELVPAYERCWALNTRPRTAPDRTRPTGRASLTTGRR